MQNFFSLSAASCHSAKPLPPNPQVWTAGEGVGETHANSSSQRCPSNASEPQGRAPQAPKAVADILSASSDEEREKAGEEAILLTVTLTSNNMEKECESHCPPSLLAVCHDASLPLVDISSTASKIMSLKLCVELRHVYMHVLYAIVGKGGIVNLSQVAGFSASESGFHCQNWQTCTSAFVQQPIRMLSHWNDLWLAKVSCHGLDFLKKTELRRAADVPINHSLNKNKCQSV